MLEKYSYLFIWSDQLKENIRNFQKLNIFNKISYYAKKFLLKNPFFKLLADFVFVVSHLKLHPAVHLNTSKALTSL